MFWEVPPAHWLIGYLLPRQSLATHMEKHDKTLRQIGLPALYKDRVGTISGDQGPVT